MKLDHFRYALYLVTIWLVFVITWTVWFTLRPAMQQWGRAPQQIAQLQAAVELVPGQIADRVLSAAVPLIDKHAGLIRQDLFGQVAALRVEVLGPDGRFVALQSAVLARADQALRIIEATRRENVAPLLVAATGTVTEVGTTAVAIRELPDRLGAELRPSWLAIQPEITCRQLDGSGYGGCWHSRVTALMGEAARVGGIVTQRAPQFVDAALGIEQDVHGWTNKYVMPHKLTSWGKIKIGLGVARDGGFAWLRSGR